MQYYFIWVISLVPRPTKFQCMVARRTQKLGRVLGVRLMGASCVHFVWAWAPIHDHVVPLFALYIILCIIVIITSMFNSIFMLMTIQLNLLLHGYADTHVHR